MGGHCSWRGGDIDTKVSLDLPQISRLSSTVTEGVDRVKGDGEKGEKWREKEERGKRREGKGERGEKGERKEKGEGERREGKGEGKGERREAEGERRKGREKGEGGGGRKVPPCPPPHYTLYVGVLSSTLKKSLMS